MCLCTFKSKSLISICLSVDVNLFISIYQCHCQSIYIFQLVVVVHRIQWWRDELQNWPVRESFIVRRSVLRDNPTLSAWESWSSGTMNRYDERLPGCNGWPELLWMPRPALGARTTLAVTAFTNGGSSSELFRLFRRKSGFACSRADTAQFKLTEGLRPVGYTHLV